jgi:hypothetical protein
MITADLTLTILLSEHTVTFFEGNAMLLVEVVLGMEVRPLVPAFFGAVLRVVSVRLESGPTMETLAM